MGWSLIGAINRVRQIGFTSMRFESDCLELVRLIVDEEDWSSLASELEVFNAIRFTFHFFSLVFIPSILNGRADLLSNGACVRDVPFSHVSNVISGAGWFLKLVHTAYYINNMEIST